MAATAESPEAEQPVKQVSVQAEADDAPKANGVHVAEEEAAPDEPVLAEETSEQPAGEAPPAAEQPKAVGLEPAEQPDGAEPAAEAREEAVKPDALEAEPAAEPAAAVSKEELPIWRKRLWFVRMPKPADEGGAQSASEHEMESYRTQVAILNESLNVKRLERDDAQERTQAAQEAFNVVREQYEARKAEAEPHRARRRELREAANTLQAEFKNEFGDLPAKSEEELDAALAALNLRLTHESMPLAEEKKAVAQIKKLEACRDKVREYGTKAQAVREARAAAANAGGGNEELEAEVQALFDEMATQRQILDTYRAEESAVRADLRRIQDERARVKGLQDEAYARMVASRNEARDKSRTWGENRRFSQQIRQVLARGEGALAEARAACDAQMNEAHAVLASDAEFRAEYFKLWEGQRKGSTSPYTEADIAEAQGTGRRGGKGGKGNGAPVVDDSAKARAEAVVAAALAQANETLAAQKAKAESAAAATRAPAAPATAEERSGSDAAAAATAAAAAALGSAPVAAKPERRSRKSSSKQPPAVVLPAVADDPFELPSAALKRTEEARDEVAEKERIREQNRTAAAEAAARKERQRKAAEEKRRAAEARRKQHEAAAKEQAAKQQQEQPEQHQQQQQQSPAAASPAASEADAAAACVVPGGDAAAAASPVAAPAEEVAGASGGAKTKQAPKARTVLPREPPRARVPAKKKNPVVRLAVRASAKLEAVGRSAVAAGAPFVQRNPAAAAVGVGALFVALLALLVLRVW